jgi:hypothetical protein
MNVNEKLAAAVQKQIQTQQDSQPTLGNYLNLLAKHAATVDQGDVQLSRASDNRVPSSASAEGMEDRNQGYGQQAEDLDKSKGVGGGKETGQVRLATGKQNLTSEMEGTPDLSLAKQAGLKFLRVDSLKRRLAAV